MSQPILRPDTLTIVENTWSVAVKIDGLTEYFYNTLFELRPEYKTTLFKRAQIKVQAVMLTSMLDTAVKYIRQPEILIPNLRDIGLRHCRYGCRAEEYAVGRIAFVRTLKHFFGDAFTAEVEAAWAWTYDVVAAVMLTTVETTEGKQMLAEYDAREKGIPLPEEFRPKTKESATPLAAYLAAAVSVTAMIAGFVGTRLGA